MNATEVGRPTPSVGDDGATGLLVAWIATVAVVGAVLWTAIPRVLHSIKLPYDPLVLLTGMTVVGLIWSAFYARRLFSAQRQTLATEREALAYQLRHDAEVQTRRRRAIAQAMLIEVGEIGRLVSALDVESTAMDDELALAHPILDRGLDIADVFDLLTVLRLAELLYSIANLEASVAQLAKARVRYPNWVRMVSGKVQLPPYAAQEEPVRQQITRARLAIQQLEDELLNQVREIPQPRQTPANIILRLKLVGLEASASGIVPVADSPPESKT